jgi:hypothetical protein
MTAQPNSYDTIDAKSSNNAFPNQNAALRGAALAFASKPPLKPKPGIYNGNNGALAAATKADNNVQTASRSPSKPRLGPDGKEARMLPQHSGASSAFATAAESAIMRQKPKHALSYEGSDFLQVQSPASDRSHSPSHIAATLAAARSVPVTPNHTGTQYATAPALHRKASSSGRSPIRIVSRSKDILEDVVDTTPVPPTTSLIGMFERTGANTSPVRKPKTMNAITQSSRLEVKSPKPIHPQTFAGNEAVSISPRQAVPAPSGHRNKSRSRPPSTPPNLSSKKSDEDASSDDSFVSASDHRPQSALARTRTRRSNSAFADPRIIDSMANAIVASSLASSRAGSPSKAPRTLAPPVPPPRRGNHNLFPHHNALDTRTPSPAKGFRQTMRKPPKEDEEDPDMVRRGRKNIMKKHPNKHHEGDRKRWRDSITERERKRYEAVWASNKGLFVTDTNPPPLGHGAAGNVLKSSNLADCVCNIVVRDIWSRSRLGADVLAEVWDLVDRSGTGRLTREEFVIGLWLIDQRLKGRKLPVRVGDSVWSSIATYGVKVKGNGRKR